MAAVLRRLRSEVVFLLAAGLSFYALVSVVPFAVLVLWLVSLITGKARVHEVAGELARHLPANLGVENALQRVADLGLRLGLGALAALLWPATAYGAGLRRSFVRLTHDRDEEVTGLRGRALALGPDRCRVRPLSRRAGRRLPRHRRRGPRGWRPGWGMGIGAGVRVRRQCRGRGRHLPPLRSAVTRVVEHRPGGGGRRRGYLGGLPRVRHLSEFRCRLPAAICHQWPGCGGPSGCQ